MTAPGVTAKRGTKPPAGDAPPHSAASASPTQAAPSEPLKPRPGLFKVFGVVFALWVAFLVVLYVKTVHPRRSTAPDPNAQGTLEPAAAPSPAP